MINGFTAAEQYCPGIHPGPQICEVCDCEVTYPDTLLIKDLGYSVCRSFNCRRVMEKKSSMSPLMFKSHLLFNKKIIRLRREKDAARKQCIDEMVEKEHLENEKILDACLNENPELSLKNTSLIVIPSGSSGLISLSSRRVRKYIKHLKDIVSEAGEYTHASQVIYDEHHDAHGKMLIVDQRLSNNAPLHRLSDKLCTMCKGGCCVSGKEHAYLSVFTMRNFMDHHPEANREEVLERYISRIQKVTIKNSCINHTETGCALPRSLRSAICNGYYCDPVKFSQKDIEDKGMTGNMLVVQRSNAYWKRYEPGVNNKVVNIMLFKSQELSSEQA